MNENTNPAKRREWVKNAAIIFLAIMLLGSWMLSSISDFMTQLWSDFSIFIR